MDDLGFSFTAPAALATAANITSGLLNYSSATANRSLIREQFDRTMQFNEDQAIANRLFNQTEARIAREFNAKEAAKAFQREAEYNSYVSQLERMREAGINPNTINSQLNSSANATAASASPASGSSASAPSIPNYPLPNFDFIRNAVNDTFQNYLLRKQAEKSGSESRNIEEMLPLNKKQVETAINKAIADTKVSEEQATQIHTLTPLLEGKTKEEINQLIASTSAAMADSGLKREQLKGEQLDNLSKRVVKEIAEKYGIVIDGNSMTTLITCLLTPNGSQIISDIINNLFKGVGKSIFEGIKSLIP